MHPSRMFVKKTGSPVQEMCGGPLSGGWVARRWEMLPSHGVPVAHSFVLDPAASSLLFASPPLPVSGPQASVPVRAHLTAWHKSASESCSVVSNSATPRTIQSTELSRSEYWSGQPFPSPEDLPNPGIKPRSPALQVIH